MVAEKKEDNTKDLTMSLRKCCVMSEPDQDKEDVNGRNWERPMPTGTIFI